jgi:hypothetical protein
MLWWTETASSGDEHSRWRSFRQRTAQAGLLPAEALSPPSPAFVTYAQFDEPRESFGPWAGVTRWLEWALPTSWLGTRWRRDAGPTAQAAAGAHGMDHTNLDALAHWQYGGS